MLEHRFGPIRRSGYAKPLPGPKARWPNRGTPVNGVAISLTTTATRVPPVDKIFVEAAWKNVGNRTALFPETNNFLEDFASES